MSHPSVVCIKIPGREYLVEKKHSTKGLMRDTSGETSQNWKMLPNPGRIIAGVKKHYPDEIQEVEPSNNDLEAWKKFFQQ